MTVNFDKLLDVQCDEIKRPPHLPAGLYEGVIKNHEPIEGRFDGDTPGEKAGMIRLNIVLVEADETIPSSMLEGVTVRGRQVTKDYSIEKSKVYSLYRVLQSLGLATEKKSLREVLPEVANLNCKVEVTTRPDKNDPEVIYNDVKRVLPLAG